MGLSSLSVVLYRDNETPTQKQFVSGLTLSDPPTQCPPAGGLWVAPPRGLRRAEGGVAQGPFFPPGRGRRTASMTPFGRSRRRRAAEARCFRPPGDPRADPPGTARRPPTDPLDARQPASPGRRAASRPAAPGPARTPPAPPATHDLRPPDATRFHRPETRRPTPIPLAASEQHPAGRPRGSAPRRPSG